MDPPADYDLRYIQSYMLTEEMGPEALTGLDRHIWGTVDEPSAKASDLVTILAATQEDPFSKWFTHKGIHKWFKSSLFRRQRAGKEESFDGYKVGTWLHLTRSFNTILASMLPIVSNTVLWYVHSSPKRLGIIAAFNALLAIMLIVFTQGH